MLYEPKGRIGVTSKRKGMKREEREYEAEEGATDREVYRSLRKDERPAAGMGK
jgi:hypothetical protein